MLSKDLDEKSEWLASRFHHHYENLAPTFNHENRKESAVGWTDVPENNKRLMRAVCREVLKELPQLLELTDELLWILGQPNFTLIRYAQCLRLMGHDIRGKAEDEQGSVIYWMLLLYLQYGDKWRDEATKRLKEGMAKVKPAGQKG